MDPIRLLLVDDEAEFLRTLSKRLHRRGLTAELAHSGESALENLRQHPADVVVLDVKMPGMSGIETLRTLKREHPLTEVILLTGHADLDAAVQGMELGAFDYLMKPMDIDELLFKIQDAYTRKDLHERKIRVTSDRLTRQRQPD
ncbi:Response regulator receiver domain-containing protein [Paucidesulfovibrio gracilis DSM 16080]|uniref:Response regulator receiver domain-containing protein n=1 Tax=Paucidesulfovibrio gracilis DSM 16080 TaxID=1121449 RepID=A0A1T4Y3S1_9BACT|nr:response regulator [Paucidesulfovibrio gracilis]SKA96449.1 Response regulator receiver domain-containing protein [Paucidesulfovibrio gracilis DSM 16080]